MLSLPIIIGIALGGTVVMVGFGWFIWLKRKARKLGNPYSPSTSTAGLKPDSIAVVMGDAGTGRVSSPAIEDEANSFADTLSKHTTKLSASDESGSKSNPLYKTISRNTGTALAQEVSIVRHELKILLNSWIDVAQRDRR